MHISGVIPFLIHWLALLGPATHKSPWSLLQDFQGFSESESEAFLPQLTNLILERYIMIDRNSFFTRSNIFSSFRDCDKDPQLYDYLERHFIDKCFGCLPFGLRACSILKVRTIYAHLFLHLISVMRKM